MSKLGFSKEEANVRYFYMYTNQSAKFNQSVISKLYCLLVDKFIFYLIIYGIVGRGLLLFTTVD